MYKVEIILLFLTHLRFRDVFFFLFLIIQLCFFSNLLLDDPSINLEGKTISELFFQFKFYLDTLLSLTSVVPLQSLHHGF